MKIIAVIVSRKDSKRINNKAFQKINNVNLIERKIIQLKKVKLLNEINVGSNDTRILNICKKHNVKFVKRPNKFCNEKLCTPNEMIKNMLGYLDGDIVLWAHLTNPFISEDHYNNALSIFLKTKKNYDSLFSVIDFKVHYWGHNKKPLNHNPFARKHIVAKNLKPVYSQNGGIFIRYKKEMQKDGRFIGNNPKMYVMDEISGWDLDYPWQLDIAKFLFKKKYVK